MESSCFMEAEPIHTKHSLLQDKQKLEKIKNPIKPFNL